MGHQPPRGFKIGIFRFRAQPIGCVYLSPAFDSAIPILSDTPTALSYTAGGKGREGRGGGKKITADDAKSFVNRNANQPVSDGFRLWAQVRKQVGELCGLWHWRVNHCLGFYYVR